VSGLPELVRSDPPPQTMTMRMLAAQGALEHVMGPSILQARDGSDLWYVIDASTAEPEVNHPGEWLEGPTTLTLAYAFIKAEKARRMLEFVDKAPCNRWHDVAEAPRDGTPITVLYDDGTEEDGVYWAETRQCMLGARAGERGPGWLSQEAGHLPVGDAAGPRITHFRRG